MWVVEGKYDENLENSIVKSFRLEEPINITSLNDFKGALKKMTVNLFSKVDPPRVDAIKKKIPYFAKKWTENYNNIKVYVSYADQKSVEGCLYIMTQDVPFGQEKPGDKSELYAMFDCLDKE